MKKILYTALFSMLALSMSSCVNKVEEVFDASASDRLEQKMQECKQLLTSATNGWMIEYYPSFSSTYFPGGVTFAATFNADGNVTVTSELAVDPAATVTSHYSINASSSVVLTFDTFNDYIHYLCDPDEYAENVYGGDFEWAYVEGDAKRMVFRGTKTDNRIVFTALEEDIVSCVQAIKLIQEEINSKLYTGYRWTEGMVAPAEGEGPTDIILYAADGGNMLIYYPDGDTEGAYEEYPFAFTSKGMTLYAPITINGITAQTFEWDTTAGAMVATDAVTESGAETTVSLAGWYRDGFIHYNDLLGQYTLRYKTSSSSSSYSSVTVTLKENVPLQSYYLSGMHASFPNVVVTYSKSTSGLALDYQSLGQYSTRGPAYIVCGANLSFMPAPGYGFELVNIGEDGQIVFDFTNPSGYTDIYFVYNNGGWGLIKAFYQLDTMTKK